MTNEVAEMGDFDEGKTRWNETLKKSAKTGSS
jgi:hypothetical protein